MSVLRIASFDPGKENHAYSLLTVNTDTLKYKIERAGMVQSTITDFVTGLNDQHKRYNKEITKLVKSIKADYIIAERFMNRGRFSGASSEFVNIMLGVMLNQKVEQHMYITAAQWKNAINKRFCLDDMYQEAGVLPHVLDACLIGIYGACKILERPPFEQLQTRKDINVLLKRIEEVTE